MPSQRIQKPMPSLDITRAEAFLILWAETFRVRDGIVLMAHAAGVSKNRIHELTGIARTTIDRIVGK